MRQQRIVIIGAGIVGLATAYALLQQGQKHVTVLEQEVVDHSRASSHGISRLLRFEYGADLLYAEMVRLSLSRWRQLEHLTRSTLYTRTGVLVVGAEDDGFTQPSLRVMQQLALPAERLTSQQVRQRLPQFATQPGDFITYNKEAGILHASTCLRVLKKLILDRGGTIHESCQVSRVSSDSHAHPLRVITRGGDELKADRAVIAAGPWVHRLLPEVYLPVSLTRQHLLYFSGLPISRFGVHAFPAFMTRDLYGFPLHPTPTGYASSWLKAASHEFGAPVHPDEAPTPDKGVIADVARKLRVLLPALQQAELAHVDACMYDVTPDEHFILDRLPHDPRIVVATGLSGHGFKFGVLLGELVSSLISETQPVVALERFRLARFTHTTHSASVA